MIFLESYRLELELVGPVHVGTGESFPAYSYLVDGANKQALILDVSRLLELLSASQQHNFLNAIASGPKQAQESLQSLWRSGLIDLAPAILRRVAVSQPFVKTVQGATEAAQLEFRTLPRSVEGAYLPGSSIKGALRTAWLFKRIIQRGQDLEHKGDWRWGNPAPKGEWPLITPPKSIRPQLAQGFEALVLDYATEHGQNLHRDPFRQVRVGDSAPSENLMLNRVGVFHPKGKMDSTVLLAEMFRVSTQLQTTLRLHTGLAQQQHKDTVSHAISAKALADACWEYYLEVLHREREFASAPRMEQAVKVYDDLEMRLEADPESFPLRIGFGSGRMSVRLALLLEGEEGIEPVTRKTAGSANPKDGYPMGWAIAKLVPL